MPLVARCSAITTAAAPPKRADVGSRKLGTGRYCMLRDTDLTLIARLARASPALNEYGSRRGCPLAGPAHRSDADAYRLPSQTSAAGGTIVAEELAIAAIAANHGHAAVAADWEGSADSSEVQTEARGQPQWWSSQAWTVSWWTAQADHVDAAMRSIIEVRSDSAAAVTSATVIG